MVLHHPLYLRVINFHKGYNHLLTHDSQSGRLVHHKTEAPHQLKIRHPIEWMQVASMQQKEKTSCYNWFLVILSDLVLIDHSSHLHDLNTLFFKNSIFLDLFLCYIIDLCFSTFFISKFSAFMIVSPAAIKENL